jgi:hypothetical protein
MGSVRCEGARGNHGGTGVRREARAKGVSWSSPAVRPSGRWRTHFFFLHFILFRSRDHRRNVVTCGGYRHYHRAGNSRLPGAHAPVAGAKQGTFFERVPSRCIYSFGLLLAGVVQGAPQLKSKAKLVWVGVIDLSFLLRPFAAHRTARQGRSSEHGYKYTHLLDLRWKRIRFAWKRRIRITHFVTFLLEYEYGFECF